MTDRHDNDHNYDGGHARVQQATGDGGHGPDDDDPSCWTIAAIVAFSLLSAGLFVLHVFVPTVVLDPVALFLYLLATAPLWAQLFEAINLPGGGSVVPRKTIRKTEGVLRLDAKGRLAGLKPVPVDVPIRKVLSLSGTPKRARARSLSRGSRRPHRDEAIVELQRIRHEIEVRLRTLLRLNGISGYEEMTVGVIADRIQSRSVPTLTDVESSFLVDLLRQVNRSLKRGKTDPGAAQWALDNAAPIMEFLDRKIVEAGESGTSGA